MMKRTRTAGIVATKTWRCTIYRLNNEFFATCTGPDVSRRKRRYVIIPANDFMKCDPRLLEKYRLPRDLIKRLVSRCLSIKLVIETLGG